MKRWVVWLLVIALALMCTGCSLFDKEVGILVYLDEDLSDAEARAMATKIRALEGTISVEYKSGEEALAEFMEDLEDPLVIEGILTELPRNRCAVTVMKSDSERLAQEIRELDGVASVKMVSTFGVKEMILDSIS